MIGMRAKNLQNFIETYMEKQKKHDKNRLIIAESSLTTLPDLSIEPVKVLSDKMAHLLNWSGHFLENSVISLTKNGKSQNQLFHNNVKNQISI